MSYQIAIPHFYCLEYTEGNKTMKVDIDFRDSIIYLNTDLIKHWNPPHEAELIDKSHKELRVKKIYDDLVNVRKFKHVILEI